MKRNRFKQNQDTFKEYLSDLKEFIQDFRGGFTQELKEISSFRVNRQEGRRLDFLPLEIWETKDRYFVQTYSAAIRELTDVQVAVRDDHTLLLKVNLSSYKPAEACWMVNSEYPNFLQREITFLHTVREGSVVLENGVLVIMLEKQIQNVELPAVYENIENLEDSTEK